MKGQKSTMFKTPLKLVALISVAACSGSLDAWAKDGLAINIPRRSELTPVQRLNREGVDAVTKRQYEKAESLFYKAYLYDPADPFTLNNLGYIFEVQGEVERARKFYTLASEQGSNANIDRSNVKELVGKPMNYAFDTLQDIPMRVNRMNVDAMALLSSKRNFEAVTLLQKALSLDPLNPFTRNNLGVAYEATGDYSNALKEYDAAAELHSSEPIVVTLNRSWRGRPVSNMAAESARLMEERIRKMGPVESHAAMFAVRGVSAANQNDWLEAKRNFLDAYALDPASAFALNNRGFVAEKDGDLETAQFYYDKARKAGDSNSRVGMATDRSAEGRKLSAVARESNHKVDGKLDKYSQDRRRQSGPIELIPRDGAQAGDSEVPEAQYLPADDSPTASASSLPPNAR
jgi:Flp pilus assembly protein TadD